MEKDGQIGGKIMKSEGGKVKEMKRVSVYCRLLCSNAVF
jgi:hypothetical protein